MVSASANDTGFFPGDTLIKATICANEIYEFNGQDLNLTGEYTAVYEDINGNDSTVTLQLTVLPLLSETITATICTGDTYPFFGLNLATSGEFEAVLPGFNGCDSTVTLILKVLPNANSTLNVGICTDSYYLYQEDTLRENGAYHYVLPAANGCDSLIQLNLSVVDSFDVHISAVICDGETYAFGDTILGLPGVYVDSLRAIGGCDSTVTLTLEVLPPLSSEIFVTICDSSYYIFHGDTLRIAGQYEYAETGSYGCDSLVIIHLEKVPSFETSFEVTICNNESYLFGTEELTEAGIYTQELIASGGCDSTVTLKLTVLPTSNGTASATICDGDLFSYNGEELTDPGVYMFFLEGANGCDSVVTFTLNVLESPNTVIEAVICHDATFFFFGETLSEEGVYEHIFPAFNGCDSTISLILTVLPVLSTELTASICAGDTYDFNGDILDESGVYTQVLASEFDCDSTVTLTLTVFPKQESSFDKVICFGETYEFDGMVLTESGTFTGVFADVNGCDSTVTLHLEVLPVKQTAIEASICAGSDYAFNGDTLTIGGVYTSVLTGTFGCDSTVTLTLTVLPTHSTTINATICDGSSYDYFGQALTQAGSFEFSFTGANGCDSTVVINLEVLPLQYGSMDASICAGEIFEFDGDTLTETGTYNFTYEGFNGCDSIFIVYLTVHPSYNTILNVSICSGTTYEFNGATLDTPGAYLAEYSSIYGCDSTINLNLTVVTLFETALEATSCAGKDYVFGTDTLTESGTYTQVFQAAGGCDSTVVLTLTVLPATEHVSSSSICAGETYAFNGQLLSEAGTYTAVLSAFNGCDSIEILNLTILTIASSNLSATICPNETYAFNGALLDESGIYTGVFTAANGCDSTVTLNLTVLPALSGSATATICAGETYDFNGQELSESGSYTSVYTAANSCDSIVTLALTVTPLPQSAFASVVCNGVPFEFNGEVLTQSGTYSFVLENAAVNGCDSVVTLFLTIFPVVPPTNLNATICAGETYQINGQNLSVPGVYTFNLSSSTGCDSVVVLTLQLLPSYASTLNVAVCDGESYQFNGVLIPAGSLQAFVYSSVNGCDSVVTVSVTAIDVNVTVSLDNGVLTATTEPNSTYQWVNCDGNQPIQGATGSTYTPTVTSQYSVIVTNSNGCTASSTCVPVVIVSVKEPLLSEADWKLQPNPANEHTSLVFKNAFKNEVSLEIFDAAGRLLQQQEIPAGTELLDLDVSGFPDGILLIRLMAKEGVASKLLMKGN